MQQAIHSLYKDVLDSPTLSIFVFLRTCGYDSHSSVHVIAKTIIKILLAGAKLPILRTSRFLLELLHTQQNLCMNYTVK
jgi:hypothetical protein